MKSDGAARLDPAKYWITKVTHKHSGILYDTAVSSLTFWLYGFMKWKYYRMGNVLRVRDKYVYKHA